MRDRTVRYTVRASIAGPGVLTDAMEYPVKHCGKPSAEGLAKFVKSHNASVEPGGCNEHLGAASVITEATLYDGATRVATWEA